MKIARISILPLAIYTVCAAIGAVGGFEYFSSKDSTFHALLAPALFALSILLAFVALLGAKSTLPARDRQLAFVSIIAGLSYLSYRFVA